MLLLAQTVTMIFGTFHPALHASATPPIVLASRSENGRFLVVVEQELEDPDAEISRIRRTTYRVLEVESFLNAGHRLIGPGPFWSNSVWSWSTTLPGGQQFWPMISNDGKTMALAAAIAGFPESVILQVYKPHGHNGELLRSYQLRDLWTDNQMHPDGTNMSAIWDSTPLWFSGGSLAFSSDSLLLVYRSRWKDVVKLRLSDGAIERSESGTSE